MVRGIVVNMGFYAFIVDAMGIAGLVQASGISVRIRYFCVESFQEKFQLAATFFAVFGLVIALMKARSILILRAG